MADQARRPQALWVAATAVALLVAGCSSLGPGADAAGDAARGFHVAVSDGDGATACDLLAPATRDELEQASGEDCAAAVVQQDLPQAESVVRSDKEGRGAFVVLDSDTVFLSVFGDAWKVTAAGCTRQGDRPYDCTVKGG